jgi:hypothetical protein
VAFHARLEIPRGAGARSPKPPPDTSPRPARTAQLHWAAFPVWKMRHRRQAVEATRPLAFLLPGEGVVTCLVRIGQGPALRNSGTRTPCCGSFSLDAGGDALRGSRQASTEAWAAWQSARTHGHLPRQAEALQPIFPQSPLLTSLMATHVTATHVLGLDFDHRLGEALDGPASERRRRRLRPARR